jgi:hypothetical protein
MPYVSQARFSLRQRGRSCRTASSLSAKTPIRDLKLTLEESGMSQPKNREPVVALDKDLKPLAIGDVVRFIMAGFFRPREQENYGKIVSIDRWGGIRIQMTSPYRYFTSSGKIADYTDFIYFVHHRYDHALCARVYEAKNDGHDLFIAKVD